MSLVTVSTKRDRVYRRAFDHEEAIALHADGWTYPALAERFGVSETAISRVCNPNTRERMQRLSNQWAWKQRKPCRGGCGRLVWMTARARTGFCAECWAERLNEPNVREDELRCTNCGEWKRDAEFGGSKAAKNRRFRRGWCRACETKSRRAHRRTHAERERVNSRKYKRKGKPMAKYVVMRKDDQGRWEEHGRVDATSRQHAVEKVADAAGKWVAVSAAQLGEMEVAAATAFQVVKAEKPAPGRALPEPVAETDDDPPKTKNCRVRDCLCMAQSGSEFCAEHAEALAA